MAIWEEFEIQCTDFLNNRFGAYAKFFHQGGADSTVPDILVETKYGKRYVIDHQYITKKVLHVSQKIFMSIIATVF